MFSAAALPRASQLLFVELGKNQGYLLEEILSTTLGTGHKSISRANIPLNVAVVSSRQVSSDLEM